jgi:hypothetical protein
VPGNRLWGPGPRAQITAEHLEDDDHYTELLEDVKDEMQRFAGQAYKLVMPRAGKGVTSRGRVCHSTRCQYSSF